MTSPASSSPPTAKPHATSRSFHRHGACNVTAQARGSAPDAATVAAGLAYIDQALRIDPGLVQAHELRDKLAQ